MRGLYHGDPVVVAWWGSVVECASAIARLEREGRLSIRAATAARARLERFHATWQEVQPSDVVQGEARRLLRLHDLRAADALQLASARAASEGRPATIAFAGLDVRLRAAAEREGFALVPAIS